MLYPFHRELILRFISPNISGSPEPNNIKHFRPISLLNVEGKLFFSILSKALEKDIFNNNLKYSSIEKGCMEKVPGCWEHMSVLWHELKSRKAKRHNTAAIWLDIANAYVFVPHTLLFFALIPYGIPDHWVSLFIKLDEGLWHIIFIGLKASIILFLSAINVIIEHISTVTENEIYNTMTPTPVKAFMDDMFLMSLSIPAKQPLLDHRVVALIWARMSFRASKSKVYGDRQW